MSGHYGLDEAVALFAASRLRLARESRELTQKELAEAAGVSAAAMSQFEREAAKPSAATLNKIAGALEFPVQFFASGVALTADADHALDLADGFGHFRSLRSVTATQRRRALSVTHLVRDVVGVLERHVRLPERDIPWLPMEDDTTNGIEDRAAAVRHAWAVPDGPIDDALLLLERHGIVAARRSSDTRTVSAYSVPFTRHPVMVLDRRWAKRDRDRFSVSHELGHIVMHLSENRLAEATVEKQAHAFAAAFLMPAEQIRYQLPNKVDWPRLLQLKSRWQVSLAALLVRARTLEVMSESLYVQAMRTMSTRGWRTDEPGDLGAPEAPRTLGKATVASGLSALDLSHETGWPPSLIEDVLADSADLRPELHL